MTCLGTAGVLGFTGCAWSPAAGATGWIALALAVLAGCGGNAVAAAPGDGDDDGGLPDKDATTSDGEVPDAVPDSVAPDAIGPECGGGYCPPGMTCVPRDGSGWCVPDADMDEVPDDEDNCPYAANLGQQDADADDVGDACDLCHGPNDTTPCGVDCCTDSDGDGIPGVDVYSGYASGDNCPYTPNPGQDDSDEDYVGDACDLCPVYNPLSPCGDPCLDSDGDGIADLSYCGKDDIDACPFTPSDHTGDHDGDGLWDVCDPDGIPPLTTDEASSAKGRGADWRLDVRRAMLARLARAGVLDEETVRICFSPARTTRTHIRLVGHSDFTS